MVAEPKDIKYKGRKAHNKPGVWYFLLFMVLLNCCASHMSVADHGAEWIARPLSELKQEMSRPDSYASKSGWKETTYPLTNGNYVYVEPLIEGCFVHWEINSKGIIVGYDAKGKNCGDASATENSITRQKSNEGF